MDMQLTWEDIVLRLVAATLLCGILGIERQIHGKPVGFRTNALVGLGAAIMTVSGVLIAGSNGAFVDVTRLASIVVQGIGFIGAGVIIQSRGEVRGLTTAATMWAAAGVGIACGFGLWIVAIVASILILFLLVVLRRYDLEAEAAEEGKSRIRFFKRK